MNKFAIHGNVTLDRVVTCKNWRGHHETTLVENEQWGVGALGNTVRFLSRKFPQIDISVGTVVGDDDNGDYVYDILTSRANTENVYRSPSLPTCTAFIIEDDDKTCFVQCGASREYEVRPIEADWHHFMYLDDLERITYDDIPTGIISADLVRQHLTHGDLENLKPLLRMVDYLIISDREAKSLWPCTQANIALRATIIGGMVRGYVVIHSSGMITASNGESLIQHVYTPTSGLRVLGAGDAYAGALIGHQMLTKNTMGIAESTDLARRTTTEYLKEISGVD